MIEGRQRDQGHRRSAEHALEFDDEKLKLPELHATQAINRLQCNIAVAYREWSNEAADRGERAKPRSA